MQIYVEYAFIENFCMDFTLLYAAKAATKNACRTLRLILPSALGACFAIVYPLFGLEKISHTAGSALGVAVKVAFGAIMCAAAGKYTRFKGYLKFTAAFTAFTFLLGGALIAIFSLAHISYGGGGGYILASVPVGIPAFFALALVITVKKITKRIRSKVTCGALICTVKKGDKQIRLPAFYDSGNKVYYGGAPVSIISRRAAEKLTDTRGIKTFTDIHTVSGRGKVAVFKADEVIIDDGKDRAVKRGIYFGVTEGRATRIVMHPDIAEVN